MIKLTMTTLLSFQDEDMPDTSLIVDNIKKQQT
jgi:hypothetical protein